MHFKLLTKKNHLSTWQVKPNTCHHYFWVKDHEPLSEIKTKTQKIQKNSTLFNLYELYFPTKWFSHCLHELQWVRDFRTSNQIAPYVHCIKNLDIAEDILLIKHNPFHLVHSHIVKGWSIHVHTNTGTYTCKFTVSC